MGDLRDDVRNLHLRVYAEEEALLKPFLFNFDINFAKRVDAQNAQFSAYIISPDRLMREGFAFTDELLLVISTFRQMQPRVMQAVEFTFNMKPFKGRVDPLTYFLVSQDDDVVHFVDDYLTNHPQARTPIPLAARTISDNKNDRWFIRNQLASRLYGRDLFDYQLPLDGDLFFFGRKDVVDSFLDGIRKGQNQGLFGLRKTGKTSFLFKLLRSSDELNIAHTIYLDCKRPNIRQKRWQDLLRYIADTLAKKHSFKYKPLIDPIDNLINVINSFPERSRICVIFDEIEYISPIAQADRHWIDDFVPFWQTLWSIQSEYRKLSFVVAGVNPYVCEVDQIGKIQNPMFGIVRPHYISGLSLDETFQMIRAIGGRLGLGFEPESVSYIHARYGGHPLLTRMACSFTNKSFQNEKKARPTAVGITKLRLEESDRELMLYFYCQHIVSELKQFYEDEYFLLELLAGGSVVDFNEMAAEPSWILHLRSYGIIAIDSNKKPSIRIPVLQRFVAAERAKREGVREIRISVAANKRNDWLSHRRANILHDFKLLLRTIKNRGLWQPYGTDVLPEADLLGGVDIATDWRAFGSCMTDLNKCLNETIDITHGKAAFFADLRANYPDLFDALHRIRLYRNNADHLRLNQSVEDALKFQLNKDLFGRSISVCEEPWFLLQQIALDELFAAIQYELAKAT